MKTCVIISVLIHTIAAICWLTLRDSKPTLASNTDQEAPLVANEVRAADREAATIEPPPTQPERLPQPAVENGDKFPTKYAGAPSSPLSPAKPIIEKEATKTDPSLAIVASEALPTGDVNRTLASATIPTEKNDLPPADLVDASGQKAPAFLLRGLGSEQLRQLLDSGQGLVAVWVSDQVYIFDGKTTAIVTPGRLDSFSGRAVMLAAEQATQALHDLRSTFGYGEQALANARIRLLLRHNIDTFILQRQQEAAAACHVSFAEVSKTVGSLSVVPAGLDFRIAEIITRDGRNLQPPQNSN